VDHTKSFYSPREVAIMASVHPSTILSSIASGSLYAVELSECADRIPVHAVITLLEPEPLTPSSMTEIPEREVAHELDAARSADTVPA
jgi:hypothetical protein